jgi:precorrin-6A synthase
MTTRTLLVIGIGPGDPRQITVEAIEAMKTVDVFFVLDKAPERGVAVKQSLVGLRQEICERYLDGGYRFVEVPDPSRDRNPGDYGAEVRRWHDARADLIEQALIDDLSEGGVGAILVWGDPALYDSTLRIVDTITARDRIQLEYRVIPGISSVSALTAAHRILLNRIGEPIYITTGRKLADTPDAAAGNQVVMLDADCSFLQSADEQDQIWWGAYLGTADEILIEGTVGEVGETIRDTRTTARERHGWIMDIYLLRKPR